MSFASHDLPIDPAETFLAPAPAAAAKGGCPCHHIWPLSLLPRRVRAPGRGARIARYFVGGGVAVLGLACLKCIVLYIVVPSVAVSILSIRSPRVPPKEFTRDSKVPLQCPVTGGQRRPAAGPDSRADGDAPESAAEDLDPAAAR